MTNQTQRVAKAGLGLGLGLGLVIMLTMHFYGAYSFLSGNPMHTMWEGMKWMMLLGPFAMLLFFGGVLILLVSAVR